MLNENTEFQSNQLSYCLRLLKCDVYRNDAHVFVLLLLLEANFSQVQ